MINTIDSEVRNRITAAADKLFEATNREQLPTVSAVRSAARVDMNSASLVMKEWRKALTQVPVKPVVVVPDDVTAVLTELGAIAWQKAQTLANDALQAAQQSWDVERDEAEAQRLDLASSFDEQATLLEELKKSAEAEKVQSERDAAEASKQLEQAQTETNHLREQLVQACAQTAQADARAVEIEKRANDLRTELDRTRDELAELKKDNKAVSQKLEKTASELAVITSKLSESESKRDAETARHTEQYQRAIDDVSTVRNERDTATALVSESQKAAGVAREEAAELRGQLKATEQQLKATEQQITEQQISELFKQLNATTKAKK